MSKPMALMIGSSCNVKFCTVCAQHVHAVLIPLQFFLISGFACCGELHQNDFFVFNKIFIARRYTLINVVTMHVA